MQSTVYRVKHSMLFSAVSACDPSRTDLDVSRLQVDEAISMRCGQKSIHKHTSTE